MSETRTEFSNSYTGFYAAFFFAVQKTIFKWFAVQFLAGLVFGMLGADKTAKFFSHLWFIEKPRNIKLSLLFWLILTCIGSLNYWAIKVFSF